MNNKNKISILKHKKYRLMIEKSKKRLGTYRKISADNNKLYRDCRSYKYRYEGYVKKNEMLLDKIEVLEVEKKVAESIIIYLAKKNSENTIELILNDLKEIVNSNYALDIKKTPKSLLCTIVGIKNEAVEEKTEGKENTDTTIE